jgi:nucleoside-diphosphate kinase
MNKEIFLNSEGNSFFLRNFNKMNNKDDLILNKLKVLNLSKMNILEIGCSNGWRLNELNNIIPNHNYFGLDPSKEAIEYGRDIIGQLVTFMTSGPVLAMVIEGNQAVGIVTKLVGGTEPLTSDIGTIRGDLTLDSYDLAGIDGRAVRNLIQCSDKPEEAEREIKLWLQENEIISYLLTQFFLGFSSKCFKFLF